MHWHQKKLEWQVLMEKDYPYTWGDLKTFWKSWNWTRVSTLYHLTMAPRVLPAYNIILSYFSGYGCNSAPCQCLKVFLSTGVVRMAPGPRSSDTSSGKKPKIDGPGPSTSHSTADKPHTTSSSTTATAKPSSGVPKWFKPQKKWKMKLLKLFSHFLKNICV